MIRRFLVMLSGFVILSSMASATTFTNGVKTVRLGKLNRTCDSEVEVQSTVALQPGTDKLTAWSCAGQCTAANGSTYATCTASKNGAAASAFLIKLPITPEGCPAPNADWVLNPTAAPVVAAGDCPAGGGSSTGFPGFQED